MITHHSGSIEPGVLLLFRYPKTHGSTFKHTEDTKHQVVYSKTHITQLYTLEHQKVRVNRP